MQYCKILKINTFSIAMNKIYRHFLSTAMKKQRYKHFATRKTSVGWPKKKRPSCSHWFMKAYPRDSWAYLGKVRYTNDRFILVWRILLLRFFRIWALYIYIYKGYIISWWNCKLVEMNDEIMIILLHVLLMQN